MCGIIEAQIEEGVLDMKRENYYVNMDSFGAMCPANWEEIADCLNDIIDGYIDELTATDALGFETLDEAELRERCDRLWEDYCGGRLPDAPVAGPIMGEDE